MELTMKEKQNLTKVTAVRYQRSGKKAQGVILDEFTASTGYNRKYAIHLLANEGKRRYAKISGKTVILKVDHSKKTKRVYKKQYDQSVKEKLTLIWKKFDWQCGKLLAPFLKTNVDTLRLSPKFALDDDVAQKLKEISPATIDRLLSKTKKALKVRGTSGTKPTRMLHHLIPTQTWLECAKMPPGYTQIDLVQHDGGNPAGEFCYTLTMTDMALGWTIHFALKNKAAAWVVASLETALKLHPMGLKGIHSDNAP
jgi:hypothetical protein